MGLHSDTFLDLAENSTIGVVSLGESREFLMREKVGSKWLIPPPLS